VTLAIQVQQDLMATLAHLDHLVVLELQECLEIKEQQVGKAHRVLQVPLVDQVSPASRVQLVLQVDRVLPG